MTDEQQNKRGVLIAIITVVLVIGLGGVVVALLVDDGDGTSTAFSTPGASIDPFSTEGLCRSAGIASFAVATDPGSAPELTATGAVQPWIGDGETSTSTSTGEDTKLVSVSKPGELPRVVLTVRRSGSGWTIAETAGCLDPGASGARACTEETLTVGKAEYRRKPGATGTGEPGALVGSGTVELCPAPVGGQQLAARGEIGPVSAYAAEGEKGAAVVTDGTTTRVFTR